MTMPGLSVVVPVYNERPNVRPTAERIVEVFGQHAPNCEILFVDDNSPDGTAEEVLQVSRAIPQVRLVQHGKKEGMGAAYHAGYHEARGDYVLCIDADLSHQPSELLRMKEILDSGYDLVVGSRYLAGGRHVGNSLVKSVGSKGVNFISFYMLGIPLTDSTHTFRAFRKVVHESICPQLDQKGHPAFQIQFSFWAARKGFRMTEIPVEFIDRTAGRGESKLSVRREVPPLLRLLVRLIGYRVSSFPSVVKGWR